MKSYLFIHSKSPFSNIEAQENIDLSLGFSAFNEKIALFFIFDGVFQLVKDLNGEKIFRKNYNKIFKTLDLYEIKDIYVDINSLEKRSLTKEDLITEVKSINFKEMNKLFESYDYVINF